MSTLLNVTNLTKKFGGVTAVNDVSFSIGREEKLGIVGPNGAGKTTLFNVITGFLRADTGSITFEDKEISKFEPHKISLLGLSRTFQLVRSFRGMNVYETMATPLLIRKMKVSKERILEMLDLVGLKGKENVAARSLTYQELKSLEIARAVISEPKLLLFDEPFGGLNVSEIEKVAVIIRQLHKQGRAIIIIEHRLAELFSIAERLIVMDFGKKIADGTPNEVMKDSQVIEAYMGRGITE